MKFTVERFEGNYAVIELEDGKILDIPSSIIPKKAREGDLLEISILEEETKKRKKEIEDRFKRLLNK